MRQELPDSDVRFAQFGSTHFLSSFQVYPDEGCQPPEFNLGSRNRTELSSRALQSTSKVIRGKLQASHTEWHHPHTSGLCSHLESSLLGSQQDMSYGAQCKATVKKKSNWTSSATFDKQPLQETNNLRVRVKQHSPLCICFPFYRSWFYHSFFLEIVAILAHRHNICNMQCDLWLTGLKMWFLSAVLTIQWMTHTFLGFCCSQLCMFLQTAKRLCRLGACRTGQLHSDTCRNCTMSTASFIRVLSNACFFKCFLPINALNSAT